MQDFQDCVVVALDTGFGHYIVGDDELGFPAAGERHVIHALVFLGHGVLILIENDGVVELQTLGAVNRGYHNVGLTVLILPFLLVVLGRQKALADSVASDFIIEHVLFYEIHELVHGDIAQHMLLLPVGDLPCVFLLPLEQHGLYGNKGLVGSGHQFAQLLYDGLLNHADNVGRGRERNLVPELFDELGEDGGVVRLFRHQVCDGRIGEGFLDHLLEQVDMIPPVGQKGHLLARRQLFGDIGPNDVAHDGRRESVFEVLQPRQLFIVQMHLVAETLFCDRRQAVGLQLDMGILVGFDVLQSHIGEIENFLIGAIVGLKLIRAEHAGTLQHIQCFGVTGAELVEGLATIRYDPCLEKNSTNF